MEYSYKEFTYASSDGKSHIFACLYTPKKRTVRGVIQILPAMCDYMGRYHELAEILCDAGFAVCGNDHLGHGHTARHSDNLGFFASEDGADTVITDAHKLTLLMKTQFGGSPLILLGQGMGSLIARLYACSYYRDIDGAIFLGTTNNFNPLMATAADYVVVEAEKLVKVGEIKPECVHASGIYVDGIYVEK